MGNSLIALLQGVMDGFANPYDPVTKRGVILMAVAENKLCWDILKPRIEKGFQNIPQWSASYGPMQVPSRRCAMYLWIA